MIRRPWLWLPAKTAHNILPWALKVYRRAAAPFPKPPPRWGSFSWKGIFFPNPLGTAGGVDKNCLNIQDWQALGAGFCEAGTVTAEPQGPNPGPLLKRNIPQQALWNHLGFPNKGLPFAARRMALLPPPGLRPAPVFVNISKSRKTDASHAAKDFKTVFKALEAFADAFVVNISSPNTKGLRDLFSKKQLRPLLKDLRGASQRPLILKLSPDLSDSDFLRVIGDSLEEGLDGWCVGNSTLQRSADLQDFPLYGGVSGKPLAGRALSLLRLLRGFLEKRGLAGRGAGTRRPANRRGGDASHHLIISCGGVMTVRDLRERLAAGAHLVQVYSALALHGPGFFKAAARAALQKEL